jgi:hypothetical protein
MAHAKGLSRLVDEAGPAEQGRDPQDPSASEAEASPTEHCDVCAERAERFIREASKIRRTAEDYLELFSPFMDLLEDTFGETVRADLRRCSFRLQVIRRRIDYLVDKGLPRAAIVGSVVCCLAVFLGRTLWFFPTATLMELTIAIGAFLVELLAVAALMLIVLLILAPIVIMLRVVKYLFSRKRGAFNFFDPTPGDKWALFLGFASFTAYILSAIIAVHMEVVHPRRGYSLFDPFLHGVLDLYAAIPAGSFAGLLIGILIIFRKVRAMFRADVRAFANVCAISYNGLDFSRSFDARKKLMKQLGNLSSAFRGPIPRQVGISRDSSDSTYRGFTRIANDISALRTWVAFPHSGTTYAFCERMALIGAALASKMYHFLQFNEECGAAKEEVPLRARVLSFTRNIALGLLPATALVVVSLTHIPISSEIRGSWTILSIGWLVASVLANQPDFKERLAASKDIFSLIGHANKP